ncbi:hypothetical protein KC660_03915 [Candidatus Dojkabacteria bacterium]|uniref:Uncharacterized protein n=1 Tax=Candidatus Dojkabacteria bacterium TaxID=2099670 RepID=A0A955RI78_9BACT|nr:hypothetical protein [Candidatus Dojkabacteria bacterium]
MDFKVQIKKIINVTTITVIVVVIEIALLGYGYSLLNSSISENKSQIKDNDITKLSIESQAKTLEDTNYFIKNNKILEDNFPKESEIENVVKEIEAIRAKSGVVDIDVLTEEGTEVNKETLFIKTHAEKDYKNTLKNVEQLRLTIVTKSDYKSTMDMIAKLEESSYLNNVYQLKISKESVSDSALETGSGGYEYIASEIGIIYYYQHNGD